MILRPTLSLLAVAVLLPSLLQGEEPIDFSREILPILSNKCFACHGPDTNKKINKTDLRLDSYAAAIAEREGIRAIDPEDAEKGEILFRLHDKKDPMPPEDAEKQLTDKERELLTKWVREGGEYADHWAFVPPTKTGAPAKDVIDTYVAAGFTAHDKKLSFAPEADRATLARRVALVLTGLPPEPEQLETFLADKSPDSYERFVDLLLTSSRFGEHQARYWLDAVRYGDTHGLHLDNKRGIYPYRDWVVRSMNENLPLDAFITQQLAGDLLPNPSLDQLTATGFVRLNPTTAEGGAIPAEFQAKNNFDRTENLGTVLLGLTMTCARCHTHKYDPITHTEYYSLLAFFNNTAEGSMDGNKYDYAPVAKVPIDQAAWGRWLALQTERDQLVTKAQALNPDLRNAQQKKQWSTRDAKTNFALLADPAGPYAQHDLGKKAVALTARLAAETKTFTTTLIAKELPKPRVTKVLMRGEYHLPIGDALTPATPAIMGAFPKDAPKNRLGLAEWLTSQDHPLVARVLTNRMWQRVFGYGLVRTPEDFGLQGEQPTHPELLDWLAVELHESNWDHKHMLRLMVTSRTFKQNSAWRAGVSDPENRLVARGPGHRLDAEVIRDMALWSSNLLSPTMGGEGVRPPQPPGLWKTLMHPGSNTKNYVADKGERLYRRSLYVYWKRTSPHPMMTLFDAPNRESSCVKRSRSSTSLQSLALLNETQRVEIARMLAERLLRERKTDRERIDFLFTLITSRPSTDRERAACGKLLVSMRNRYANAEKDALDLLSTGDSPRDPNLSPAEVAAWTQVAVTVLASDLAILLY